MYAGALVVLYVLLIKLIKFISKKTRSFFQKKEDGNSKEHLQEEKHQKWLLESFDIDKLPQKIDFRAMPEPSGPKQKMVIAFWRTKAKVCKPYAK